MRSGCLGRASKRSVDSSALIWGVAHFSLLLQLEASEDWEDDVDEIMTTFEQETQRKPLYTICFY